MSPGGGPRSPSDDGSVGHGVRKFGAEAQGSPRGTGGPAGRGRVRCRGAARPGVPRRPRSHHAILDAGFGGAASARCDEQPRAGLDLQRVQRERGPVELRHPPPAHGARRAPHSPQRERRHMPPRGSPQAPPSRLPRLRSQARALVKTHRQQPLPVRARPPSPGRSRRLAVRTRTRPAPLAQAQSRRHASALALRGRPLVTSQAHSLPPPVTTAPPCW